MGGIAPAGSPTYLPTYVGLGHTAGALGARAALGIPYT